MTWRTFLRAHWPALVAADVFTTEVWTTRGLVTYYTAFVIELESRRVQMIGTTPYPDEAFLLQCLRPLTSERDGLLRAGRTWICDRDPKWSRAVEGLLDRLLLPVSCAGGQCRFEPGTLRARQKKVNRAASRHQSALDAIRHISAAPFRVSSRLLGADLLDSRPMIRYLIL